ncbi:WXG100 family type VII secretion target [Streptosporangium sp. NPDC051023]|uniref:WXG100 family type VII secretion target n=1 Tax=Streptosporangium sp. NPDC051023 TaxID=3155410 RepID=UPI00344C4669
MEKIGVNFEQMARAQDDLLLLVTAMDEATDSLVAKIRSLLSDDSWNGGAAEYFETHRSRWDASEREMGRQLHEAAKALGVANESYRLAEMNNQKIWSEH